MGCAGCHKLFVLLPFLFVIFEIEETLCPCKPTWLEVTRKDLCFEVLLLSEGARLVCQDCFQLNQDEFQCRAPSSHSQQTVFYLYVEQNTTTNTLSSALNSSQKSSPLSISYVNSVFDGNAIIDLWGFPYLAFILNKIRIHWRPDLITLDFCLLLLWLPCNLGSGVEKQNYICSRFSHPSWGGGDAIKLSEVFLKHVTEIVACHWVHCLLMLCTKTCARFSLASAQRFCIL